MVVTAISEAKSCAFCRGRGSTFEGKQCVACCGVGAVVEKTIGNGRDICLVIEEPAYSVAGPTVA